METSDVVRRLIGPIEPVGETHTDYERLENIKAMTALIAELLRDVSEVAQYKDCPEYSRKQAGRYAEQFIRYIHEEHKP